MFKHGKRTSTLSLLGWHPCVLSSRVVAGPSPWVSKTVRRLSVRERGVIYGHLTQTSFLEMGVEMLRPLHFSSSSRQCWHLSEVKREGAELLLVEVLGNKLLFQATSSSVHEVSLSAKQALRGII